MGSIKSSKAKRGYFGKVESSLNEKLENVEWGEFKIGDLFEKIKTRKLPFKADQLPKVRTGNYTIPCLTSSFNNQGLNYFAPSENVTILKNVISIPSNSDVYRAYYQPNEFTVLSDAYAIRWAFTEDDLSPSQYLFAVQCINKITDLRIYSYKCKLGGWNVVKGKLIKLPTKSGEIDFEFMESFITELEAERIAELEAYLEVTGLSDCELTEDEQKSLNKIGNVEWGEFKVGDLFEKLTLRNKNSNFNKLTDTSKVQSDEFDLPLVNAKVGDNGIMFYGRSEDFESEEMTIDVISNGAIATGTVYAQPQKTGVLWDAYLLKSKFISINKSQLIYLSASLQKSIKLKFGWEYKAVWSKVQKESIQLPVKDGKPDFEIMTQFISAIQKITIKDVVEYADTKIQAHKEVVLN